MRAAATAPSLATSNASRKDLALAGYQSCRAATLLNRVASYSSSRDEKSGYGERNSGGFCEREGVVRTQSQDGGLGMERKEPFEIVISQCELLSLCSSPARLMERNWRNGENMKRTVANERQVGITSPSLALSISRTTEREKSG